MTYSSKIVLAIDTVIGDGSISLWRRGIEVDSRLLENGTPQSETLLEALQQSLTTANIALNEIDCIAVSVGPGSYTGIRVGIASVLGIAAANEIETIGISTLRSIAADSDPETVRCLAVLSIGGDDLISQEFQRKDVILKEIGKSKIISISQLSEFNAHEIITDRKTHPKISAGEKKVSLASDNIAKLIAEIVVNGHVSGGPRKLTPIYSREFLAKMPKP